MPEPLLLTVQNADALLDQRLRVLNTIERLGKPSIATLFGFCLGGGLELPLACHFRIAADQGAQIGLPEMDLGGVPAWGGCAVDPRQPRRRRRHARLPREAAAGIQSIGNWAIF